MLFLRVNGIYTPQIGTRVLTDLRIESVGQACLASHNYKPTGLVFFFKLLGVPDCNTNET